MFCECHCDIGYINDLIIRNNTNNSTFASVVHNNTFASVVRTFVINNTFASVVRT